VTIVMQHPEIGTIIPSVHKRIAEHVIKQEPTFAAIWQYLSQHPAESSEPWMENTYVKDLAG
jgi:hypothetical protein